MPRYKPKSNPAPSTGVRGAVDIGVQQMSVGGPNGGQNRNGSHMGGGMPMPPVPPGKNGY